MKSNVKNEAISPEERLCVTLQYVVTGDAHVTIVAIGSARPVSVTLLKKLPRTDGSVFKGHWFYARMEKNRVVIWEQVDFPHCLGAIDGKHIIMQAPAESGSLF